MTCDNGDEVSEIGGSANCSAPSCVTPVAVSVSSSTVCSCSCGCEPCRCSGSTVPFYNQAAACQESHIQVYSNQSFVAAVTIGAGFNMPACNVSVAVSVPGLINVQPGSYFWSTTYGYLKVVSFDAATQQVTLMNECQLSNATPGTAIPSCTMFTVVDPPYEPAGGCGEGVFTTANFVAPGVGASVTIQVTGTEGLTVNGNVQVGTGTYQLTVIVTATSVTIKNNGSGHVPGTVVPALNALGECVTPVTPYGADPCNEVVTTPGALVICSRGTLTTLNAFAIGQVPVCIDPDTNEVEFQTPDVPSLECTFLTACMNLLAGVTVYTIVVDDSSIFYEGQLIVIKDPNIDDKFWVITDIPDGTHLVIEATTANAYTGTALDGTEVCEAFCCDQLDYELNHLGDIICDQDWSSAFRNEFSLSYEAGEGATINAGDPDFVATTRTITFSNGTCNHMLVMCHAEFFVQGTFDTSEMSWARVALKPYIGSTQAALPGVPAVPVPVIIKTLTEDITFGAGPGVACNTYNSNFFIQYHHTEIFDVPPNTALRIDAYQKFAYSQFVAGTDSCCGCVGLGAPGSGEFTISGSTVYLHGIGAAMQET